MKQANVSQRGVGGGRGRNGERETERERESYSCCGILAFGVLLVLTASQALKISNVF